MPNRSATFSEVILVHTGKQRPWVCGPEGQGRAQGLCLHPWACTSDTELPTMPRGLLAHHKSWAPVSTDTQRLTPQRGKSSLKVGPTERTVPGGVISAHETRAGDAGDTIWPQFLLSLPGYSWKHTGCGESQARLWFSCGQPPRIPCPWTH